MTATFAADASAPATFTRYLAEGVASAFFDTRLVLANPGARVANAQVQFLRDDGVVVERALTTFRRCRRGPSTRQRWLVWAGMPSDR